MLVSRAGDEGVGTAHWRVNCSCGHEQLNRTGSAGSGSRNVGALTGLLRSRGVQLMVIGPDARTLLLSLLSNTCPRSSALTTR